jgi:hypothetical protein
MANQVKVIKTEKGKDGISYHGYLYRYDKKWKNGTISWRCLEDRYCLGRIATADNYSNPVIRNVHYHPPNPDKTVVREVRTTLRARSAAELTPLPIIYHQETLQLAINPTAAAIMPTFRNVATSMQRDRQAKYPPLPRNRQSIIVPQTLQQTINGQQFLLATGQYLKQLSMHA